MAGITKTKYGTYRVRWRDPSGEPGKRTFKRRADADRFAAEVEGSKVRGHYIDPTAGLVTFREYAETVIAARSVSWRPTTAQSARMVIESRIYPELGAMPLASITSTDLGAFLGRQLRRSAPATVEQTWHYTRLVLRSAHRDRRIGWDPTIGVAVPRRAGDDQDGDPRALVLPTHEEVTAILAATPSRFRAAVALGAGCGMRIGEVLGLAEDMIDLERGEVRVERQLQRVDGQMRLLPYTKTRRGRRALLVPGLVRLELRRHLRDHGTGDGGLLFTGGRGAWLRRQAFYTQAWRPALAGARIERSLRFHDLRHFVVSSLLAEGVPTAEVAAFVRDTPETIRRTYEHALQENRELARLAIDRLFVPAAPVPRPLDIVSDS